ncbi:polyprenyl diphosphate synthase [Gordonia sp. (in: high G+C Gram-positive bacteria)]|uniref:polyprenyl diphosphate synthase n=1 Tax=Gordonia sp. (in: high G+C Gram-positive bacteria) TaxID=84139 RepID=UPI0019C20BBD|nr:di-trans,poly-cis-decaprenylcistransferase [Gordonia sp. (in: high G+C Gram-positive bacteria)]
MTTVSGSTVVNRDELPRVPAHVGFILDGNRRWARSRGMNASAGHLAGFSRIPEILTWCEAAGIHTVTLWMMSTDNLRRDAEEVDCLAKIIEATVDVVGSRGIGSIRHLGSREVIRKPLLDALDRAVERTSGVGGLRINLAVCYGGREEIVDACRQILARCDSSGLTLGEAIGRISVRSISEEILGVSPAPELIVRTSGERRSSGFLLWAGMYSTMCVVPGFWPDFGVTEFRDVLLAHRDGCFTGPSAGSGEQREVSVR